ncbi:MAG: hypothetical protein ACOWWO_06640 [Peptococcaceae bacterium]
MSNKIIFVYNQINTEERRGIYGECTLVKEVDLIRKALLATDNVIFSLDLFTPEQLESFIEANLPIDSAFIIAEGFKAQPQTLYNGNGAALVRKTMAKYNIPCSHSGFQGMEICRHKDLTYARLRENGVLVPEYLIFDTHFLQNIKSLQDEAEKIGYPLIIKPNGGGNSIGISRKSVVKNFTELKEQAALVDGQLGHGNLIMERYLPGQEYTLGIIGNVQKFILPVIGFPHNFGVRDSNSKKIEHQLRDNFEMITTGDERFDILMEIGAKTFDAVSAHDIIRIDLKEDPEGNIYVIDVNGTPALSQTGSLNFMACHAGMTHAQLIQLVLYESLLRNGITSNASFVDAVLEVRSLLTEYLTTEVA